MLEPSEKNSDLAGGSPNLCEGIELRMLPFLGFAVPRIKTVFFAESADSNEKEAASAFHNALDRDRDKDNLTTWSEADCVGDDVVPLYMQSAANGCTSAAVNMLPFLYMRAAVTKDHPELQKIYSDYDSPVEEFIDAAETMQRMGKPHCVFGDYWLAIAVGYRILENSQLDEAVSSFQQTGCAGVRPTLKLVSPVQYAKSLLESIVDSQFEFAGPAFLAFEKMLGQNNSDDPEQSPKFQHILCKAVAGYPEMQVTLANIYSKNDQPDMAYDWYQEAAASGYVPAYGLIGSMLYEGTNIEKNIPEALSWFRKSISLGDPYGALMLGKYAEDYLGAYSSAFQWFLKAAQMGNAEAQYKVGNAFKEGKGIDSDKDKSAEWYRKAADQGYSGAEYQLGIYYKDKNDLRNALEWLRKSASRGDCDSMFGIGNIYMMMQDKETAIKWYQKAAEQGDMKSEKMLKDLSVGGHDET